MSSKLFVIHGAPELTREIQFRLNLESKKTSDQRNKLAEALETRTKNLGPISFLQFRLLHREFYEKENKAIRWMVISARCATQGFKKWKQTLKGGA